MTEESTVATDPRDSLSLKLDEPEVSPDSPWDDDVLNRAQIAERLTNLIRTQSVPFVVSIDGYWGTGKTFMLKRWQKDLEKKAFHAIYFNAWEDDFCDDPLLAIIGQLSEHFKKEGRLRSKARQLIQVAKPLFRPRSVGLNYSPDGISNVGVSASFGEGEDKSLIDGYLAQRATKDQLKRELCDLSVEVANETGHPLVFIIDELDRCRPTFAVELLERVKHIFDVPNLVFVVGINRDELCNSLRSVYGEIETDIYLRRFFDMEFTLPEVDSQVFCKHLFEKFELENFFTKFSESSSSKQHIEDYGQFSSRIPELWSYFGLSLRDVDYCVRLIAMSCRNLKPSQSLYPWMLGLLIALKFNNQHLYQKLIRGQCLASEVMNYVHSLIPQDSGYTTMARTLALMEGYLYVVEDGGSTEPRVGRARSQFMDLFNGKVLLDELPNPEYLSERAKGAFQLREQGTINQDDRGLFSNVPEERSIASLLETIIDAQNSGIASNSLQLLSEMIDLHQSILRR